MRYLKLAIPGNPDSIVSADGNSSENLLEALASILRVGLCGKPPEIEPVVMLSDTPFPEGGSWYDWLGSVNRGVGITWDPETLRYRFCADIDISPKELQRVVLRRILALTLLRQVIRGRSLLCHGALLELRDRGGSAVLIGRSGMGKTTASRRLEEQGGRMLSDDKFLLTLCGGIFYAQPLPTWSRYLTSDVAVSFGRAVRADALIILSRGEGDRIGECDSMQWTLEMLNSFQVPLSVPAGWLPRVQIREYMKRSMEYLPLLQEEFGLYQMQGDLNGKIHDELETFLRERSTRKKGFHKTGKSPFTI